MATRESTETNSEIKAQYEKKKKFEEGYAFFSSLYFFLWHICIAEKEIKM
jgi:hypothetical protein